MDSLVRNARFQWVTLDSCRRKNYCALGRQPAATGTGTWFQPADRRLRIPPQGPRLATRPTPVVDRPKLDRGRYPKRNENEQHDALDDREWRLGLGRRERVKGRDLHEPLCDKHEHVEIKRRNRADDKDPSPRPGEAKAVSGNFFLLPPSHNIYMSRRIYMSSGLVPR